MTSTITDTSLNYHLGRAQQEMIMAVGSLLPVVEARHAELARMHSDHAVRLLVTESFVEPIPVRSPSPMFDLLAALHTVPFDGGARSERSDPYALATASAYPPPARVRFARVGDQF